MNFTDVGLAILGILGWWKFIDLIDALERRMRGPVPTVELTEHVAHAIDGQPSTELEIVLYSCPSCQAVLRVPRFIETRNLWQNCRLERFRAEVICGGCGARLEVQTKDELEVM